MPGLPRLPPTHDWEHMSDSSFASNLEAHDNQTSFFSVKKRVVLGNVKVAEKRND